jgi:hypothetical protein
MLDGDDKQNFYSLMRLRDVVSGGTKPIVFWVGAGASRWCGYPSWEDLAEQLHSTFSNRCVGYDRLAGAQLLSRKELPVLFGASRVIDSSLYNKTLTSTLSSRPSTPVYDNFIQFLSAITPLYVLTTNVDEALEQHMPTATIVQNTDLDRCIALIQQKQTFVGKLHGSISSIEHTIFTADDYLHLEANSGYMSLLTHVFREATVIFIGYGLKDEYVVNALSALQPQMKIFGNGPHFFVTSVPTGALPSNILPIKYFVGVGKDHRGAIATLDIIKASQEGKLSGVSLRDVTTNAADLTSGYYVSDFTPPGTWTSSQTLGLGRPDGTQFFTVVGQGFVQSEVPSTSPSPGDFIVGLLCFDRVYLPLASLAPLHNFVGGDFFWELVYEDVLRFVHVLSEPGYIYESSDSLTSVDVGLIARAKQAGGTLSVPEEIRRQVKAEAGRETEAELLFEQLESKVLTFDSQIWSVPTLVRGALLHPRLRRPIGMSDGVFPTAIPRWLVFPALRVAHTINTAALCQQFNLAAAKLWFGGEMLVGATFGLAAARDWAHEAANYVALGQPDLDLGAAFNIPLLQTILKFRNTNEGTNFRRDLIDQLKVNAGSEFISSVNAALKRNVPLAALAKSHRTFSALLGAMSSNTRPTPAIWHNSYYSDNALQLWRKRSLEELLRICSERKIGIYDRCPCGSGEKLKFCCVEALSSSD